MAGSAEAEVKRLDAVQEVNVLDTRIPFLVGRDGVKAKLDATMYPNVTDAGILMIYFVSVPLIIHFFC